MCTLSVIDCESECCDAVSNVAVSVSCRFGECYISECEEWYSQYDARHAMHGTCDGFSAISTAAWVLGDCHRVITSALCALSYLTRHIHPAASFTMSRCVQRQALRLRTVLGNSSQASCLSGYRRICAPAFSTLPLSTHRTRSNYLTRHFSTSTTTSTTAVPITAALSSIPATKPPTAPHSSAAAGKREVKVVSYYLSPLDLVGLTYPPTTLKFTRPACTLVPLNSSTAGQSTQPLTASTVDVYGSYAIVFDYGAIVFFNASEAQQQLFLPHHHRSTTTTNTATATAATIATAQPASLRLKDDYTVIVDPLLTTHHPHLSTSPSSNPHSALTCAFHTDSVHVSALDVYSVRVIAQILAQTISMEYYEHRTSAMLAEFHALSLHMSHSGTLPASLTTSSSSNLIKLLAQNNTILTTILTHIRLLDRSEISWRYGQYDTLWEGLRTEFSIADRYDTLETKLRLLHENHPLFLEVLHHKSGHRMELIIIALIAIEVLLAVVFHSPIVGWVLEELGMVEKGRIKAYD